MIDTIKIGVYDNLTQFPNKFVRSDDQNIITIKYDEDWFKNLVYETDSEEDAIENIEIQINMKKYNL